MDGRIVRRQLVRVTPRLEDDLPVAVEVDVRDDLRPREDEVANGRRLGLGERIGPRRELGRRHDLSSIRDMPKYRSVQVIFGTPIKPSATDVSADDLAERVRNKVLRLLQDNATSSYLARPALVEKDS